MMSGPFDRAAGQGQSSRTHGASNPSYQVNVNRQKTRKWVEAKMQSYDGDDWGASESDEEPASTPPETRTVSSRPAAENHIPSSSQAQQLPPVAEAASPTWDGPGNDASQDTLAELPAHNDEPKRASVSPQLPNVARMSGFGPDLFWDSKSPVDKTSSSDPVASPTLAPATLTPPASDGPATDPQKTTSSEPAVVKPADHPDSADQKVDAHEPATLEPPQRADDSDASSVSENTDVAEETRATLPATGSERDAQEHLRATGDPRSLPKLRTPSPHEPRNVSPPVSSAPGALPSSSDTSPAEIIPTEPLQPKKPERSPSDYEPQTLERQQTIDTVTSSPVKESDVLSDEIMRTLTPGGLPSGNGPTADKDSPQTPRSGKVRDSSYTLSGYDDYWGNSTDREGSRPERESSPTTTGLGNGEVRSPAPPVEPGKVSEPSAAPAELDAAVSSPPAAGHQHVRRKFSWEDDEDDEEDEEDEEPRRETVQPAAAASPISPSPVVVAQTVSQASGPSLTSPTIKVVPETSSVSHPSPQADSTNTPTGQLSIRESPSQASDPSVRDGPPPGERGSGENNSVAPSGAPPAPMVPQGDAPADPSHISESGPGVTAFRDILNLPTSAERISKYVESREAFGKMDSGLGNWITVMQQQFPEHANSAASFSGTVSAPPGASASPTLASTQQPYYQQYLNASSPATHAGSSRSRLAGIPIQAHAAGSAFGHSGNQIGTKGKEFVQSAGKMGKGLFSKGKSKLRGTGDKDEPSQSPQLEWTTPGHQRRWSWAKSLEEEPRASGDSTYDGGVSSADVGLGVSDVSVADGSACPDRFKQGPRTSWQGELTDADNYNNVDYNSRPLSNADSRADSRADVESRAGAEEVGAAGACGSPELEQPPRASLESEFDAAADEEAGQGPLVSVDRQPGPEGLWNVPPSGGREHSMAGDQDVDPRLRDAAHTGATNSIQEPPQSRAQVRCEEPSPSQSTASTATAALPKDVTMASDLDWGSIVPQRHPSFHGLPPISRSSSLTFSTFGPVDEDDGETPADAVVYTTSEGGADDDDDEPKVPRQAPDISSSRSIGLGGDASLPDATTSRTPSEEPTSSYRLDTPTDTQPPGTSSQAPSRTQPQVAGPPAAAQPPSGWRLEESHLSEPLQAARRREGRSISPQEFKYDYDKETGLTTRIGRGPPPAPYHPPPAQYPPRGKISDVPPSSARRYPGLFRLPEPRAPARPSPPPQPYVPIDELPDYDDGPPFRASIDSFASLRPGEAGHDGWEHPEDRSRMKSSRLSKGFAVPGDPSPHRISTSAPRPIATLVESASFAEPGGADPPTMPDSSRFSRSGSPQRKMFTGLTDKAAGWAERLRPTPDEHQRPSTSHHRSTSYTGALPPSGVYMSSQTSLEPPTGRGRRGISQSLTSVDLKPPPIPGSEQERSRSRGRRGSFTGMIANFAHERSPSKSRESSKTRQEITERPITQRSLGAEYSGPPLPSHYTQTLHKYSQPSTEEGDRRLSGQARRSFPLVPGSVASNHSSAKGGSCDASPAGSPPVGSSQQQGEVSQWGSVEGRESPPPVSHKDEPGRGGVEDEGVAPLDIRPPSPAPADAPPEDRQPRHHTSTLLFAKSVDESPTPPLLSIPLQTEHASWASEVTALADRFKYSQYIYDPAGTSEHEERKPSRFEALPTQPEEDPRASLTIGESAAHTPTQEQAPSLREQHQSMDGGHDDYDPPVQGEPDEYPSTQQEQGDITVAQETMRGLHDASQEPLDTSQAWQEGSQDVTQDSQGWPRGSQEEPQAAPPFYPYPPASQASRSQAGTPAHGDYPQQASPVHEPDWVQNPVQQTPGPASRLKIWKKRSSDQNSPSDKPGWRNRLASQLAQVAHQSPQGKKNKQASSGSPEKKGNHGQPDERKAQAGAQNGPAKLVKGGAKGRGGDKLLGAFRKVSKQQQQQQHTGMTSPPPPPKDDTRLSSSRGPSESKWEPGAVSREGLVSQGMPQQQLYPQDQTEPQYDQVPIPRGYNRVHGEGYVFPADYYAGLAMPPRSQPSSLHQQPYTPHQGYFPEGPGLEGQHTPGHVRSSSGFPSSAPTTRDGRQSSERERASVTSLSTPDDPGPSVLPVAGHAMDPDKYQKLQDQADEQRPPSSASVAESSVEAEEIDEVRERKPSPGPPQLTLNLARHPSSATMDWYTPLARKDSQVSSRSRSEYSHQASLPPASAAVTVVNLAAEPKLAASATAVRVADGPGKTGAERPTEVVAEDAHGDGATGLGITSVPDGPDLALPPRFSPAPRFDSPEPPPFTRDSSLDFPDPPTFPARFAPASYGRPRAPSVEEAGSSRRVASQGGNPRYGSSSKPNALSMSATSYPGQEWSPYGGAAAVDWRGD